MINFCTLCDRKYLEKGLALYQSLINQCKEGFRLHWLCIDDETYHILANTRQPIVLDLSGIGSHFADSHNRKELFRNEDFFMSHCPDCGEDFISLHFTKQLPESAKVLLETLHGILEVVTVPDEPNGCVIVKEKGTELDAIVPKIVEQLKALV